MVAWKVTVRAGPRVEHLRFEQLETALDTLESRGRELASSSRTPVSTPLRNFEPAQQVAARLELVGPQRLMPSFRGGVDIRGDGSSQAYIGQVRRRLLEPRRGENAYQTLRRDALRARA